MSKEEKFTWRIDDLGRIYLPKPIRKFMFGTEDALGEPVEICYGEDGTVILKPCIPIIDE